MIARKLAFPQLGARISFRVSSRSDPGSGRGKEPRCPQDWYEARQHPIGFSHVEGPT